MNKKLVLSVLSTAVVASMASAAFAKPQEGFYIGGETPKYYSNQAILQDFDNALKAILGNASKVLYVNDNMEAAPFLEALGADKLEDVLKTATKADFEDKAYEIVGDPDGKTWDPVTDPDLNDPVTPGELKVESVSAIETTYVEVTFPALAEALEGVTVEVKDSKSNVVEVQPTNIAKGATFAQFDFVKAITADDQTGVWTVAGVEYSFVAKAQLEKIVTTAGATNDVAFRSALDAAGIKNVNNQFLSDYKTVITAVATAPKSLTDVQKIVDDVNAKKANSEVVVKPVLDAKNQIDLLAALEANFARVNRDWIESYITADGTAAPGIEIKTAPAANTVHPTAAAGVPATAESIQAAIDAVNLIEIAAADAAVTGTDLKASEQAKVTALIQQYQKDDEGTSKTKANAIKASQVKEAVLRVKEAGTQNSVYTTLVNLSNVDADNLKASELNAKIASFYFEEQKKTATQTALAAKTTASVKSAVVQAADTEALKAALDEVEAKYTALNADDTNATKKAAFKASLQKLADFTSHTDKFDISKVNDANLVKYAAEFAAGTAIDNTSSVADVTNKIKNINDGAVLDSALDTVNDAKSSATQVRDALLEIAVSNNTGGSAGEAKKYINLSAQAKLEVAELVIEDRPAAGFTDRDEVIDPADGTGALKDAVDAHATKIGKFNAIGDLASATTDEILEALADYEYDNFDNLSTVKKLAVAEEIAKLTKKDSDGKDVALNFGGADAVKTFAQANAIIDAAIESAN